jgi:hypothetical protein
MGRLTRHLAIVAAIALAGCGYKPAGSTGSRTGTAGTHAGGAGGMAGSGTGGAAGIGGGGGLGGSGGTGGTGGSLPIIYLDGGNESGSSNRDANCGARSKTAMKVAPDILIVLDRSGSMNDDVSNMMCRGDGGPGATTGCGATSKWAQITPAITQVVSDTENDVNWGLKFFPDNSANPCDVTSTAAVDIAPSNSAAIAAAIMGATSTNGGVVGYNGTPTRAVATGATTYLSTLTDKSPKYILLATDGLPTCATSGNAAADDSAGAPPAIAAAKAAGFPTFVVGIATGGSADGTLSAMADAGGLARQGTPSYYPVSSAADLAAAIRTLIKTAATCTFQIGPNPTTDGTTSLDKIDVTGDGQAIERDMTHTDGYDYTDDTHQSIQVYGPRCEKIMSGEIQQVSVTFICLVT